MPGSDAENLPAPMQSSAGQMNGGTLVAWMMGK